MSMQVGLWVAAIIGVAIIAWLAFYAGSLLARLKRQNQRRDEAISQRIERINESIVTIAKAMEQEQCPLSEGCLRIVVLLDHRPDSQQRDFAEDFPAMHDMYERIKHMPTHEARKQFPKKEIRKLDNEREGYEVEMKDIILADIRKLLSDYPL
ncbi:DUF2489 domain-containing protein [Idiomarina tyrosinivorans]|uniref:DUF2489 domain-containing protein n=1 Tax=Idiomarina tyrosinivorans TaxID=1445662 RepID=A0A432ZT23_9GAMM|nr:DUF2489 domain-containing protein [Idiomarina tyrosinivorans]RUO81057.1 DUF2489 domain-containing protein [Idiomarina tyrosinivorans]